MSSFSTFTLVLPPYFWLELFGVAISLLVLLTSPCRLFNDRLWAVLLSSLAERELEYNENWSVKVELSSLRFVTAAQSSAVTCASYAKAYWIPTRLLATPEYPPCREFCWLLRRSSSALIECYWNLVQVLLFSTRDGQVRQSSMYWPVSATRSYAVLKSCPSVMGSPVAVT